MHHRHVGLIVAGAEIVEELEELMGGQHPLVDQCVGRQRTEVGKLPARKTRVAPQAVAGVFADDVELALEGTVGEALAGPDEELLEMRHRREHRRGQPRAFRAVREPAPSQAMLSLSGDDGFGPLLANPPLQAITGEECDADPVLAGGGKADPQLLPRDPGHKPVRQPGQESGPIARSGLATYAAAVPHAAVDTVGVVQNGPAGAPLDIADEADPAALVLVTGIVQPPGGRRAGAGGAQCVHGVSSVLLLLFAKCPAIPSRVWPSQWNERDGLSILGRVSGVRNRRSE